MRLCAIAWAVACVGLGQQRLEILNAVYGSDNAWIDVTERVRGMVRNDALELRVDIPTMGQDPLPGIGKTLRLRYRWSGAEAEIAAGDFEEVRLPPVGGGRFSVSSLFSQPTLRIVTARYGGDGRWTDVRERLEGMVRDDRLGLRVDNQTMGSDPAVGKTKYLEVAYEFRGNRYQARVREERSLNIPSAEALAAKPAVAVAAPAVSVAPVVTSPPVAAAPVVVPGGTLRIFYARYGADGREADVREKLRANVRDGRLNLRVDNEKMGGDPARGAGKRLYVIFEYRGRTFDRTVAEGQVLALP